MILKSITLENFRNHAKSAFSLGAITIFSGKNTVGKTNILEAIHFSSTGKSFRAEKEADTIRLNTKLAKINATVSDVDGKKDLTVLLSLLHGRFSKRFLVNRVPKRQVDFVSNFYSVLFTPTDIDIISLSPSLRRKYIDSILSQASREYRVAQTIYEKSLRHRNRMLFDIREKRKIYRTSEFEYWDNLLVENGKLIKEKREEFVYYINGQKKNVFSFDFFYDKSTVTHERLAKYYHEERAAGMTLIGPQRDDFLFFISGTKKTIRDFGSRGEQRLTLLQMKTCEIQYLKQETGEMPALLLDDIFSELDAKNIENVFSLTSAQQTIITTTHKEFVPRSLSRSGVITYEL